MAQISLAFVALSAVYDTEYRFILLVCGISPEPQTMQSVGSFLGEGSEHSNPCSLPIQHLPHGSREVTTWPSPRNDTGLGQVLFTQHHQKGASDRVAAHSALAIGSVVINGLFIAVTSQPERSQAPSCFVNRITKNACKKNPWLLSERRILCARCKTSRNVPLLIWF